MKPYGRQHYSRIGKRIDPAAHAKLSPPAAAQLTRMFGKYGADRLARMLGTTPTTLYRADRGVAIRSDVAARLSAALERLA